uniref:G_PROTEIN_RECEP_F1_2 domain-containing protein n=1 Tax=Strongyloides papillosus TaxID=174720 RepID=A0A0N5BRF4_STREA
MNHSTNTTISSIQLNTTNDIYLVGDISEFMKHSTSEIVEMICQLLIFIIGTPLNIHAFIHYNRKKRNGYAESRLIKLSKQLIITHLMVLPMCLWRTYWFYNIVWNLGNVLCKIHSFAYVLPFHLWSNIVAAIAIDMLCCIRSPLSSYRNGEKRVSYLIWGSWISAIVCASPMLLFRETVLVFENYDFYQCSISTNYYNIQNVWNAFHVITVFYIPLIVVILCYILIGLSLRRQMRKRKCLQDESQPISNNHTQVRFLKATVIIIASFVLTWLPYQILALLRVLCKEHSTCSTIYNEFNWLQTIMIASTCINPFLYKFGRFKSSLKSSTLIGSLNENCVSTVNHKVNRGSNVYIRYTRVQNFGKIKISRCKHYVSSSNPSKAIRTTKEKKKFNDIPNDEYTSSSL